MPRFKNITVRPLRYIELEMLTDEAEADEHADFLLSEPRYRIGQYMGMQFFEVGAEIWVNSADGCILRVPSRYHEYIKDVLKVKGTAPVAPPEPPGDIDP